MGQAGDDGECAAGRRWRPRALSVTMASTSRLRSSSGSRRLSSTVTIVAAVRRARAICSRWPPRFTAMRTSGTIEVDAAGVARQHDGIGAGDRGGQVPMSRRSPRTVIAAHGDVELAGGQTGGELRPAKGHPARRAARGPRRRRGRPRRRSRRRRRRRRAPRTAGSRRWCRPGARGSAAGRSGRGAAQAASASSATASVQRRAVGLMPRSEREAKAARMHPPEITRVRAVAALRVGWK